MDADQIEREARAIAEAVAARKVRAMVYDVDAKERLAIKQGVAIDAYYDWDYQTWRTLRDLSQINR